MAGGQYRELLKTRGFPRLVMAQFLGALNDNLYKMVVSLLAVGAGVSAGGPSAHLSLVGAIFILPFLLFSGYAGHAADVFSKRRVLVAAKLLEAAAMGLGFIAFLSGRFDAMLSVLFLMALHSTFFGPAKYGILPEMLSDKDLSRANGLLEMATFLAIILGTTIGSLMFALWKERLSLIAVFQIAIALAGIVAVLGVPRVPRSGAQKAFAPNPWAEIGAGVRRLYLDRALWFTVMGISYFWFLGALLQLDLILFGKELMHLEDLGIGLLMTSLAVGIGAGSIAAGRLSGDKVELGLTPLGSIGIAAFSVLLAYSASSPSRATLSLALLGFSGGLFVVPLNAFLQQRSGREEKGRLIATNNFLNTVGILIASAVLWLFRDIFQIPADAIVLIFGLVTIGATVYILGALPDFLIRFTLWLLTHAVYKIRIVGQEHVPFRGPALLVCNHVSHVDGFIVGACVQRFIRFMIYRPYYELKPFHWLFRLMRAIPASGRNRKELVESIELAREALDQGHVVCIFAEGAISRTGNLLPFKRGFEKIVEGRDIPVIPVCLDRLWGSIFSFKDGRFFWKRPERVPYPVTVVFGKPLARGATAREARQAILELGSEAVRHRRTPSDLLHLRFIRTAKRRWFSFCMADSAGEKLGYGGALTASLLLARRLAEREPANAMVGIMLPASVPAALANIAALLAGKVPVNLNFTAGKEALSAAIERCGIRTILTSRLFLTKARLEETAGMTFLEELTVGMTMAEKAKMALRALLLPASRLRASRTDKDLRPDSLATVIFSSGSTGIPKGVMLSHHNILSNIEGMAQLFWVNKNDRMMGALPFFHAFGFTAALWFPLVAGFGVVYHSNPTDAKAVGELVAKHKGTILISTPTFYSLYARQCSAEQFRTLRYAMAGAEKLSEPVAAAFKEKFGLDLLEGYGCTEMGPVVSVNVPDVGEGRERQTGHKPGTVGHPLPGIAVKVVDPVTGAPVGNGEEGLLLVNGPNRMLGYLGQPEQTAAALRDGWYVTGDIGATDEDGFIRITDRLARFSKIGGEMVPHIKVEEAVTRILGAGSCAVVAIPDERKGEQLAVLYAHKETRPEQLWHALQQTDLPKLWIPKRENMHCVETLPLLGTGKLDIQKARTIAMEKSGK